MKKKTQVKHVKPVITGNTEHSQLLTQFRLLFLICKFAGLYSYNLQCFRHELKIKRSFIGTILVLCVLLIILSNFIFFAFWLNEQNDNSMKQSNSMLTLIITIFLTYIGLSMMVVDQLNGLRNHDQLQLLYDRFNAVDLALRRENIHFNNEIVAKFIRILLFAVVSFEILILFTSIIFLHVDFKWANLMWISYSMPSFLNSLDKIWFCSCMWALQIRFHLVNQSIEHMTEAHKNSKLCKGVVFDTNYEFDQNIDNAYDLMPATPKADFVNYMDLDFLRNELSLQNVFPPNRITPDKGTNVKNIFHTTLNAQPFKVRASWKKNYADINTDLQNTNMMEVKLNNLCHIHDELCEIGRLINKIWNFPILILMAYGFLMFTSQLFFFYCASQKQNIAALFRSAYSLTVTGIILAYVGGKCVFLIYMTWKTSLECKRTGICLHKFGVAADNKNVDHIVNHLSLILLNHCADFTACGFFSLDMQTIFEATGAITSYLIILIQFNLAALQAKMLFNSQTATANTTVSGVELLTTQSISIKIPTTALIPVN